MLLKVVKLEQWHTYKLWIIFNNVNSRLFTVLINAKFGKAKAEASGKNWELLKEKILKHIWKFVRRSVKNAASVGFLRKEMKSMIALRHLWIK